MRPRREQLVVVGNEPVGSYTLLRVARGHVDPGQPGQFFMLATRERLRPSVKDRSEVVAAMTRGDCSSACL